MSPISSGGGAQLNPLQDALDAARLHGGHGGGKGQRARQVPTETGEEEVTKAKQGAQFAPVFEELASTAESRAIQDADFENAAEEDRASDDQHPPQHDHDGEQQAKDQGQDVAAQWLAMHPGTDQPAGQAGQSLDRLMALGWRPK